MHPMLTIATRAARSAGNIIMRNADRLDRVKAVEKSQSNDFVSDVDKAAEDDIIYTIKKAYPTHSILAEESGEAEGTDPYQWIIDPLDGTTNFLHGFGHFSVSIALMKNNKLEVAVIYDPIRDELFTAERGGGAHLNNRRIRVAPRKELDGCLMATGLPFCRPEFTDTYLKTLKPFMNQCAGIRRAGSAALDLAYVAAGRVDGFWEFNLKPWDIAAGILLVQEAGGLITDTDGGSDYLKSGNIIAANTYLHKQMHKEIKAAQES